MFCNAVRTYTYMLQCRPYNAIHIDTSTPQIKRDATAGALDCAPSLPVPAAFALALQQAALFPRATNAASWVCICVYKTMRSCNRQLLGIILMTLPKSLFHRIL